MCIRRRVFEQKELFETQRSFEGRSPRECFSYIIGFAYNFELSVKPGGGGGGGNFAYLYRNRDSQLM